MKFTELYENLSPKESALVLSERFGVAISDNSEIPEEVRRKAQLSEVKRQEGLVYQQEVKGHLRRLGALICGYRRLLDSKDIETDISDYIKRELPMMEWKWEYWFAELKR